MKRKTALITGGAHGIGRQISICMAKAGYDVAINYHNHKDMAEEVCRIAQDNGANAQIFYANMGSVDDIRQMYHQVTDAFGTLDAVINNAGISKMARFLESTEEDFDLITSVDWKGLFFSSQFAARYMIEHEIKGVIINLSSNHINGCWPRASIYGATKAAVSKFTQNAGMELARKGIRMVAIAPGYTDIGWDRTEELRMAEERLPLQRFASTEEIAKNIVYLASDEARYMIGSTVVVDGGATLPVVACNDFG